MTGRSSAREFAHLLEDGGELALFAEVLHPQLLQSGREVRRILQRRQRALPDVFPRVCFMIVILLFYMLPQGAVGKMGKEKPSGPNWGRKVSLP